MGGTMTPWPGSTGYLNGRHSGCCAAWPPGYYDAYGNWVFGYYRTDCGYYGY